MKILLLILLLVMTMEGRKIYMKTPTINFECCLGSSLRVGYIYGSYPMGEENQYILGIKRKYKAGTIAILQFDSETVSKLNEESAKVAVISVYQQRNTFIINYLNDSTYLDLTIKGVDGVVPYINSMIINGVEHCHTPLVGYLDRIVKDSKLAMQVKSSLPNRDCGRRKLEFTELIVNGKSTAPGEWPWHAAVYRHTGASNSYICGGTLISKLFVLTAAHCTTVNKVPVVPDILSVVLGKYHSVGNDISSQERQVFAVIVHTEFGSPLYMDNDIALLKLKTEAVYNDYVQPACLWTSDAHKPSTNQIIGSVVGWGITQTDDKALSPELKQASLPIISEAKCYKSSQFYWSLLRNNRKFCAGWGNGTSPCNGDSGGGFMVYVPDTQNNDLRNTGAWHVRGITSMTIAYPNTNVCDPTQYVLYTDITAYEDWIRTKTHENVSQG